MPIHSAKVDRMWGLFNRARRRETADRERHRRELRYLEFLRDEIFAKPDIARMYWHTRHPGDLEVLNSHKFVEIAGTIRPEESNADSAEQPFVGLLRDFFAGLTSDDRAHLIRQLGVVFRSFGRGDLADRPNAAAYEPSQR